MLARRLATGLAALCVALVAVGCGSSGSSPTRPSTSTSPSPTPLSAAAYRSALHQVAQEEDAAQQKVGQAFHARTVAQVRAALTAFASDQGRAAARLGALTPPADAATANAQLARAFSDNATAIDSLLTKLADAKTAKQALAIVQNDKAAAKVGREIDAALGTLKKLGYTSGS